MPFRSRNPIVSVEPQSMRAIDTTNVENLFGLWSIFNKCAETMEDGKRYENMSWRLWNRETFCCAPDQPSRFQTPQSQDWQSEKRLNQSVASSTAVPELSSSVESEASSFEARRTHSTTLLDASPARPELVRHLDTCEGRCRGKEKHIRPADLEKIILSIKDKKKLEPLSPLPLSLSVPAAARQPTKPHTETDSPTNAPSAPPARHIVPESSTSTVATVVSNNNSAMSPSIASSDSSSTSTDVTTHSVQRGFTLTRASSSVRSQSQLGPSAPAPILKTVAATRVEPGKKRGATFQLGCSSDDGGDSSLETSAFMARSSLSEGLRNTKKRASFLIEPKTIPDAKISDSESAIETDSEEDEVSESAIEDDDWEDESDDESGPASVDEKEMFQRVDSRPNLTSRRSLLTTLMHEGDRAVALQAAASRSVPALRRSRTSSPNGPSLATSPDPDAGLEMRNPTAVPRSKPIIMTTSNIHPPALSPRTTRRNMLQQELTESLRVNLIWERQVKNSTSNAALKRRHTSNDVKNLRHYPGEPQAAPLAPVQEGVTRSNNPNSWNNYFDHGLQEYHSKGW